MEPAPILGFFHQRDFVNEVAEFIHEIPRYVNLTTTATTHDREAGNNSRGDTSRLLPRNMSLDFLPSYPHLRLVDCCNGLLLCISDIGKSSTATLYYYVCNPATKQWLGLHKPRYLLSIPVTEVLYFDPRHSPNFKLIIIHSREAGHLVMVDVYHSETARWFHSCMILEVEEFPLHFSWDVPVLFGGFLYKLASRDRLLRYNVTEFNSMGIIPLPMKGMGQVFVGRSGGCLYCAFVDVIHLLVWELRDWDSQKWVLKHDEVLVGLVKKCAKRSKHKGAISVVAFHPDSPVIFLAVYDKLISFRFGSHDWRPEVFCTLKPIPIRNCEEENFKACLYKPCFSDLLPTEKPDDQ